jgi:hypothetical protein
MMHQNGKSLQKIKKISPKKSFMIKSKLPKLCSLDRQIKSKNYEQTFSSTLMNCIPIAKLTQKEFATYFVIISNNLPSALKLIINNSAKCGTKCLPTSLNPRKKPKSLNLCPFLKTHKLSMMMIDLFEYRSILSSNHYHLC